MAPSPAARASACARSPRHETYRGTAPWPPAPGTGMSRIGRPPSTWARSSPASSPRTSSSSRASRAMVTGPRPSVKRPVNPAPIAARTRPGARTSSVRRPAAVATGARRPGTTTPIPSPMRRVRSAARASVTKGSA